MSELKPMTARRAIYFMERFKKEEKLLGPNEQAAVDYVIAMLEAKDAQPAQAGQVLTRDDIVDAWMAVMHIAHATQRQEAFARAIESLVRSKQAEVVPDVVRDAQRWQVVQCDPNFRTSRWSEDADGWVYATVTDVDAAIAQQKGQP